MESNARIFQEMRSADQLRGEMKAGIIERMRNSGIGQALGAAYDSPLAHGIVSGLRDAYRRLFEQGYYGHDVFDGRWHMDTQGPQVMQGMDRTYDQRAAFYGWDQHKASQDRGNEEGRDQGYSYSRGR